MSDQTMKVCICASEGNQDADCPVHGEWYRQRDAHNAALAATPLPAPEGDKTLGEIFADLRALDIQFDAPEPLPAPDHGAARAWDGSIPKELEPTEDDAEQLRRFAKFLDSCRGDEVIEASSATDFRVRRFHQAREEAFHRIGLLVREVGQGRWRGANDSPESAVPVPATHPAPAARVTSEMVDRALSKACYHLALLRPDEPESNDERLREHLKHRLIAKHLTAALSAGGK